MNKDSKNNLIDPEDLFRILEEKKTSGDADLDDFEKDALEGFESLEQVDSARALYEDTLKQISDRVSESGASKRKGGVVWWSMAAGLALLIGLFFIWFNSEKNIQNQNLALSNQKENVLSEETKDVSGKPEQALQQQLNESLSVPDQKTLADANSKDAHTSNGQGLKNPSQPAEYSPSQSAYKAADMEEKEKELQKSSMTSKEEKSQVSTVVASNQASSVDEKSNSENARNRKETDKSSQDNDVMYDQVAAAEQNNTNVQPDEASKNMETPAVSKKSAEKEMALAYETKAKNDSFKERSLGKKSKAKTKSSEPSIAYTKTEEKSQDEGNSLNNNISLNKQADSLSSVSSTSASQPVTVTGAYGYASYFEKAKYKSGDEELKKVMIQKAKENGAYVFPSGKYQINLKISQNGTCQSVSLVSAPASCHNCLSMLEKILKEIRWEPATQNGKTINSDLLLNLTF